MSSTTTGTTNITDLVSHTSSAGDMRLYLQTLLDRKEKQLQQAGALGQRVLAQQVELEERVRELQELDADKALGEDDEIDADMRERYRQLAQSFTVWDAENVQLSTAFGKVSSFCFLFGRFGVRSTGVCHLQTYLNRRRSLVVWNTS